MLSLGGGLNQKISLYREWLEAVSPFFKRNLFKRADAIQLSVDARNAGFQMSDDEVHYFSVFGGQRSDRESIFPTDRSTLPLSLVSAKDVLDRASSNMGRKELLRVFPADVRVDCPIGVRDSLWRKAWLPLATGEADGVVATIFLDKDPMPGVQPGSVVLEEMSLGWESGWIRRRIVASSLERFFEALLHDLESGAIAYTPKIGVHRVSP